MLGQLANVDTRIAQRVANGLGHDGPIQPVSTTSKARTDLKVSPALSILAKAKPSLQGRVVGCLIADGTDSAAVAALANAVKASGAKMKIIAPKVGGARGSDGKRIVADLQLAGGPSVLFDAVFLAVSTEGAQQLATQPGAVGFVQDAYSHLKVIGHLPSAAALLEKAGVATDRGIVSTQSNSPNSFIAEAAKGRVWEREPKLRPVT